MRGRTPPCAPGGGTPFMPSADGYLGTGALSQSTATPITASALSLPEQAVVVRLQPWLSHETAAAWMRRRLSQTKPVSPWDETLDSYRSRLKACAAYINNKYDVDGLCMALPRRLSLLEESWGDRISK